MSAESKFEELVASMRALLQPLGLSRRGRDLVLQSGGNLGIVNFQKSANNTAAHQSFTVNLGVFSPRIAEYIPPPGKVRQPGIWDCHWRQRLGQLIENRDRWWDLDDRTDLRPLEAAIGAALTQTGVPELRRCISDAALRDLWLSGSSPGLTEVQRLMHLLVLLKELGPADQIPGVLQQLQRETDGKVTMNTAGALITKLGLEG